MGRQDDVSIDGVTGDEPTIYDKLIGRFKKPRLSRSKALQARPIRNPGLEWEELDSGEVRIVLPRRRDTLGRLMTVLFYIPKSRPVNLDVVGSKVWKMADGKNTVDDIAEALVEDHKLHRREAEVSLTEFLKMLGKRNMVAFAVPQDMFDELDAEKLKAAGTPESKPDKSEKRKKASKKRKKGKEQ